MKILLTGASSYVGARLFFDLREEFPVVGTCYSTKLSPEFLTVDVTDMQSVKEVVKSVKPEIIIHVAANANARWCEANPELATKLNDEATANIVDAANTVKAKVILISSYAAIEPMNVYSRTKSASEDHVKKTKAGYLILRPSYILGFSPNTSNDRPFNRLLKNLSGETEAEYDNSWKFQPTYLHHISEVILSTIKKKIWNQTIHITTPDLKSRYEVARDILKPFGIEVKAVNQQDQTPIVHTDLHELEELDLPQYTYAEMIDAIIKEIQHREQFTLE